MTLVTSLETPAKSTPVDRQHFGYSISSFQRPSNTTAYASGDVVIASATPAALEFVNCGRSGAVYRALLGMEETSSVSFDLFIFNAEPTNQSDNEALALASSDLAKLVAIYNLNDGNKINVGTNLEVYVPALAQESFPYPYAVESGTSLYGLLVARTAFTPASATEFNIILQLAVD